jgi:hypothetical protein
MPKIPIDCDLLRRVLKEYFRIAAENRAYFFAMNKAAHHQPWLRVLLGDWVAEEAARQREQTSGHQSILRDNLDAQDAAAVHRTLSALFPNRLDRED